MYDFYIDMAEVNSCRRRAKDGDAKAMYELGIMHKRGERRQSQSTVMATNWFAKAADLKHVPALCEFGWALVEGKGVKEDVDLGKGKLWQAMLLDSQYAHFALARSFHHGWWGHNKNLKYADKLYRAMHDCSVLDAPRWAIKDGQKAQVELARALGRI